MRKWVIVGLVWAASAACASSGRFGAVSVSSTLAVQEEYGIVPPTVQRFTTSTLASYLPKLVKMAEARNIEVHFVPDVADVLRLAGVRHIPEGAMLWGYNTATGHIFIAQWLSVDEQFSTLVHELGHSLQPRELDGKQEAQVFVEALAILVCHGLGKDFTRASFPYIVGFERRHDILLRYANQIDALTTQLLKELRK